MFGLTLVIAGAWGVKMVLQKKISIQRTPIDIPILLFLLSQVISTLFSLDMHTSLWGYYSRFNGGLLSILSYIFLYYAFVSNFTKDSAKKSLFVSLASGAVVTLWGLPSHFGFDPTCYLFRGNFDVSCWTDAFQPKIRIFSTLGQPNWLAAYLSILLPISIAFGLVNLKSEDQNPQQVQNAKFKMQSYNLKFKIFNFEQQLLTFIFALLTLLFYIAILFTGSRSGFAGLTAGLFVFFFLTKKKNTFLQFVIFPLLVLSLWIGTPVDQQLKQLTQRFFPQSSQSIVNRQSSIVNQGSALETGGTESGTIRLIVWKGALDIWLHNPLFGTGVETFAFAYYKYKPIAHNMTSEWDYLYNKAHNEYLNYLATTGAFGLGSYLLMIGTFLFVSIKKLKSQNSKLKTTTQNSQVEKEKFLALNSGFELCTLSFALIASYVSILVSNFLGFSVVIMNIYLFLIPAFVFVLAEMLDPKNEFVYPSSEAKFDSAKSRSQFSMPSALQWVGIASIILASLFFILTLFRFWQADKSYALGQNLDNVGEYQNAYLNLADAVDNWTSEPVFMDEFSYNSAVVAVLLASQKDATQSGKLDQAKLASYSARLAKDAMALSNAVVAKHPNNIVFWKTRVKLFSMLSQIDSAYLSQALDAIKKAHDLAPTDAKVSYSLAILYGQNNDSKKAIETLQETIQLKPDYRDAYYALSLFYHDQSLQQKAKEAMQYILDHFSSSDAQAKKALETWK